MVHLVGSLIARLSYPKLRGLPESAHGGPSAWRSDHASSLHDWSDSSTEGSPKCEKPRSKA